MQEIKKIRLSQFENSISGNDISVSLYKIDSNNYKTIFRILNKSSEYSFNDLLYPQIKKDDFKSGNRIDGFNANNIGNYDYFLNETIIKQSRIDRINYVIVQDPYLEENTRRRFGKDPYYLNNGSIVYINWILDGVMINGIDFSDSNGNELDISSMNRIKDGIIKEVQIINGDNIFTIDNSNKIILDTNNKRNRYKHFVKDTFIIDEVIRIWKVNVINYNLMLCSDSSKMCSDLEYISPLENIRLDDDVIETDEKKKLTIDFITKKIKSRNDFILKIKIN
jgi:hypothetical protein